MSVGVVSFQWFFWGYSLAFSHTAGKYIGDLQNFGMKGVLAAPSVGSDKVPDLLFAVFQGMFACITYVAIIIQVDTNSNLTNHTELHSLSAPSLNVAACFPAWSSFSFGPP